MNVPHKLLGRLMLAWPILVFTVINACWLAAGISLGRPPVPYKDDPKFINAFVTVLYYPAVISLVAAPLACLSSLIAMVAALVARGREERPRRAGILALSLLLWIGLWAVLRFSPYRVIDWLMD